MDKETVAVIAARIETMTAIQHPRYLAYMLRLWRVKVNGKETWRASLESVQTGDRRGFADLEGLLAFLKQETQECSQCEKESLESKRPS